MSDVWGVVADDTNPNILNKNFVFKSALTLAANAAAVLAIASTYFWIWNEAIYKVNTSVNI